MPRVFHVSPNDEGRWELRLEGESRAESVHPTMNAAFSRAADMASDEDTIRIHESAAAGWLKQSSDRAVDTRIQGEKAQSPKEAAAEEEPRGVEALEQEGIGAGVTDADTSPTMEGQNTRTGEDLEDKIRRQDRK